MNSEDQYLVTLFKNYGVNIEELQGQIKVLSDRRNALVRILSDRGYSMQQIADMLGLSKTRVSQINSPKVKT